MGPKKTPKNCPICNREGIFNKKFDAYFCSKCNIWLEPKCGNIDCEFCRPRPRYPQQNPKIDIRLRFLDKILGEKNYKKTRFKFRETIITIQETILKAKRVMFQWTVYLFKVYLGRGRDDERSRWGIY